MLSPAIDWFSDVVSDVEEGSKKPTEARGTVADLLAPLTHLTETIERHYFGELHRLARQRSAHNRDPDFRSKSYPPF